MVGAKNDFGMWVTIGVLGSPRAKQPDDRLAQSACHVKGAAVRSYDKTGRLNCDHELRDRKLTHCVYQALAAGYRGGHAAKLRPTNQQAAYASKLVYLSRKLWRPIERPSLPGSAAEWMDHNVRVVRVAQRRFAPSLKFNASLRVEV